MREPRGLACGESFGAWFRDDAKAREAIVKGEEVEVEPTAYADNDFLLEFLMGTGLWERMVSVRPEGLRKENGKPWRALNGLEVLRELVRVKRIAHCGRVIRDTRLMMLAGFNAEALKEAGRRRGRVVTPETLSNHLGRMSSRSVVRAFYDHVSDMRDRGWIGGGVYAADAHEMTFPHARSWEGMGQVGQAHGYKLLLLVRVAPEEERIVGFAFAPLQASERLMLRMVLRQIQRQVCPVRKLIEVLVLDRGYWGAEFLMNLRERYGIQFVTRAQHDGLEVVQEVEGLMRDGATAGPLVEVSEERSRLGKIAVRLRSFEEVPLSDGEGKQAGKANVVVADEYDCAGQPLCDPDGTPRPRMYYVTSLPVREDPHLIRRHYLLRWVIENEGFRNLTQRWSLDIAAGRSLRVILARIFFVLILANAEMIVRELFPGPWQEERRRLGDLGVAGWLGGELKLVAYTMRGQLGLLSVNEYGDLVAARERDRLTEEIRSALGRGERIDDILQRLKGSRPSP